MCGLPWLRCNRKQIYFDGVDNEGKVLTHVMLKDRLWFKSILTALHIGAYLIDVARKFQREGHVLNRE